MFSMTNQAACRTSRGLSHYKFQFGPSRNIKLVFGNFISRHIAHSMPNSGSPIPFSVAFGDRATIFAQRCLCWQCYKERSHIFFFNTVDKTWHADGIRQSQNLIFSHSLPYIRLIDSIGGKHFVPCLGKSLYGCHRMHNLPHLISGSSFSKSTSKLGFSNYIHTQEWDVIIHRYPTWSNNHMFSKVWNDIIYPFPLHHWCIITYPCWDQS